MTQFDLGITRLILNGDKIADGLYQYPELALEKMKPCSLRHHSQQALIGSSK